MLLVAARGLVQLVGALRLLATGVSEDLFSGGHVRPVGAAVVSRMLLHLGHQVVLVRGDDGLFAACASDAQCHGRPLLGSENRWYPLGV
jgi:hypothetical protein